MGARAALFLAGQAAGWITRSDPVRGRGLPLDMKIGGNR